MKTVLIVDDDASALRALARLVAARHSSVEVLTACNGKEAVAILEARPVDLVLTDLQMPELNGFELLTWMMQHVPATRILPMSAYLCDETNQRLLALGPIECLTKPVDLEVLSQMLNDVLAPGIQGYVQNIGLPSLLQLLELEQKTCTMSIACETGSGLVHLVGGRMVHAETGEFRGDDAALEMAAWRDLKVTLDERHSASEHTVKSSLGYILMEAARRQDERRHSESKQLAAEEPGFLRAVGFRTDPPPRSSVVNSPARGVLEAIASAEGVKAVAVVNRNGAITESVGACAPQELRLWAEGTAEILAAELSAVERQMHADTVEDMLITSLEHCELIRPIASTGSFVLLLLDRRLAAPAMVGMKVAAATHRLVELARALPPDNETKDWLLGL
ncbi:MAG TPA: response regulator [Polyangiaceae bacterium]|nr:response regulator [Polyangiaceae bacterium]